MRDYTKVSPCLWHDAKFKALKTSDEKLLYCYYKTGPHQNSAGCCHLPDGYGCSDLGWSLEQYLTARAGLIAAGMVQFDADTSELLIEDWFADNPPTNLKHMKGIRNQIGKVRSERLKETVFEAAEAAWAQRMIRAAEANPASTVAGIGGEQYDLQDRLKNTKSRFGV
jgi:hypothetical protein